MPVEDAAFNSLCAMLRNLVQKNHGHVGSYNPSEREIADVIGPLLYGQTTNVPHARISPVIQRIIVNDSLDTLGRFLRIARNLDIITCTSGKDLCERIVANVRTIGTARPSRKGLMKAFGEPNANNFHEYATAQRKVRDICMRIIAYIDNQGTGH